MSILQKLGARSVVVVPHGKGDPTKASRLCACLALAAATVMSGAALAQSNTGVRSYEHPAQPCYADVQPNTSEDENLTVGQQVIENTLSLDSASGTIRVVRLTSAAIRTAVDPLTVAADAAIGGAVGAATGNFKLGKLAGANTSALILASAANPIAAGMLLISAGHNTMAYIEEANQAAYKEALKDTVERICQTRQSEALAIRLADRHTQSDWTAERRSAHNHYIRGLIKDSASSGQMNQTLQSYVQTEADYMSAGGSPSEWVTDYLELDETLALANSESAPIQNDASPAVALSAGLTSFEQSLASRHKQKLGLISLQITPDAARSFIEQASAPLADNKKGPEMGL
ncbi:hypothetical protein [Stutzerimonas stutzeri]|uniref:hypothetical protein n=1 Tax=Stutzerimonas stutzeri TaxID=316 RepID=UPI0015E3326F|nr:hypothetical protein [Stutzerimonas stutzeri]MBA1280216.1 hypothetical protein [Stutzerimonas stutzeri]